MSLIKHLENNILKYDLINKFSYTNSKKLPKLKTADLNFSCKTNSYKNLATSLLAIEFISKQKGVLTQAKKPNLAYKIRKNSPTGCKIKLRKQNLYRFVSFFIDKIFPNLKNFTGIVVKKKLKNVISYELTNVFIFPEIERNYIQFKNLSKLQVSFVFQCLNHKELKFMLQSVQFIIKN